MSYHAAAALQGAVFQRLRSWAGLSGVLVVDAVPPGDGTGSYVMLGTEQASDESDASGGGVAHVFGVSVISDAAGFMAAKGLAAEVCLALNAADLDLKVGSLVSLTFVRALAKRLNSGENRRIDLTFRARITF